jgi:putative SOS response-associated peptidase YedK
MCNRYANTISYRQYVEEFSQTRLPLLVPAPSHAPNLEPRLDIRPTDRAPVLLPIEGGLELREMRWGLIPWFHKKTVKEWKPLTTNARSETIDTTTSFKSAFARRRCLIPASAFYEWTGEKGKKIKWRFSVPGAEWFCFAGIWDRAHTADGDIESYALATLPPDALFEQYHDRRPLILDRADYAAWLDSPDTAKALYTEPKDRDLTVERAA